MGNINAAGQYDLEDGIAVITLDSPPVNALSASVRAAIVEGLHRAHADPAAAAVVLICAGKTFIAGADITEFGKPPRPPSFEDLVAALENGPKPVIAAIHGTALGGGLETALLCHYRVAEPSARLGLPEVHLGLLPGGGGTQRLPRIIGVEAALDVIVTGRQIGAGEALRLGIIDAETKPGALRAGAINFARQVVNENRNLVRIRDRDDMLAPARGKPALYEAYKAQNQNLFRGVQAPEKILEAVRAAVELPFDQGIARERALINELMAGRQSAALRYIFFAEREAAKIKNLPKTISPPAVASVAILGAGAPAQEAARLFAAAGLAVAQLDPGQTPAWKAPPDLIIAIGPGTAPPDIAAATSAPVIGLKFSGRLMEVRRTSGTSPATIAAAMQLGRQTGKIAVLCHTTFITDRLAAALEDAVQSLAAEGITTAEIAAARYDYGFSGDGDAPGPAIPAARKNHIRDALLCPVVNEGAALLAGGTAQRASDIDMAAVAALAWPAYTGGPMFWAATIGLPHVVATLRARPGGAFTPHALLARLAETGQDFQSETANA